MLLPLSLQEIATSNSIYIASAAGPGGRSTSCSVESR